MARTPRNEVFSPEEVAIIHVMNRVVRRCFLLGDDEVTGKNYDHRRVWIEDLLKQFAAFFGMDLLTFAILSNHFHLVLRSRPDVVKTWDDSEVARRWLMLCPVRKCRDGTPQEPNETELNSIRCDSQKLSEIRSRLSNVSWWMRLLCQRIATRSNREDGEVGKFWESRFRAVRLLDEASLVACAAYVELNPIRAAMSGTLEASDFTSVQRRLEAINTGEGEQDRFLAPLFLDERMALGPSASLSGHRCSDKGFLPIRLAEYRRLLEWTAGISASGTATATTSAEDVPPILTQLSLESQTWKLLVGSFGRLFSHVAGKPAIVDHYRSPHSRRQFRMKSNARKLLTTSA